MGKAIAKQAGVAAIESTLRAVMPELMHTLASIQQEIRDFRASVDARFAKVDDRFSKIDDRFTKIDERLAQLDRANDQLRLEVKEQLTDQYERLLELINELGHRLTRVDQRLKDYGEFVGNNASKMDNFLERLVRLETAALRKRRRAG